MEQVPEIDRLPIDMLAQIFVFFSSYTDMAQASSVCKRWKQGVEESLAQRKSLSFAGWEMDDESIYRLVCRACNLRELDMHVYGITRSNVFSPRDRWGCQITDNGLFKLSMAKCVSNLKSISLWGMTGITDEGVVQLISRTRSLEHLNVGGTFITDESLFAIARSCLNLETIVLWRCHHVTEGGLIALVDQCHKLKSINIWGTRLSVDCLNNLRIMNPALQIKL